MTRRSLPHAALAIALACLLSLWLVAPGEAAVTKTDSGTAFKNTNGSTTVDMTTFTVTTGSTLLVAGLATNVAVTGTSMTWDNGGTNQALTSVTSVTNGTYRVEVFSLLNPTAGNKTLHAAWTGSADSQVSAVAWSGTDTTTGIASGDTLTSTSATFSMTVTSTTDGATVVFFNNNQTITAVDQTQIFLDNGGPKSAATYALGGTSNVHTMTTSSGSQDYIGVHVIAAAGGAGPQTLLLLGVGK